MSILAGIMIGIGCMLYLQIGGIPGACLFSVGLMSVCLFDMKLFTGQAGKLATLEIKPLKLLKIWIGNFVGIFLVALVALAHPNYEIMAEAARNIMASREAVGFFYSFVLGIPCGMLMYCAVTARGPMRLFYIMICVAAFILGGFYHCIADLFYTWLGAGNMQQLCNVLFVTLGNLVGCNLIPLIKIIPNKIKRLKKKN